MRINKGTAQRTKEATCPYGFPPRRFKAVIRPFKKTIPTKPTRAKEKPRGRPKNDRKRKAPTAMKPIHNGGILIPFSELNDILKHLNDQHKDQHESSKRHQELRKKHGHLNRRNCSTHTPIRGG